LETTFAILVFCSYTIAWILGWWRWQDSSAQLDDPAQVSDGWLPGRALTWGLPLSVLTGLVCLSVYLILKIQKNLVESTPPSGWFVWGILGSWLLVAGLVLQMNHRRMHVFGLFLLPVAAVLFGIGYFSTRPSPGDIAASPPFWRWLHAGSLLVGTVAVVVAFSSGVLYMIQSNRLKQKRPSLGFAIPSLEKLQVLGERGLICSTLAVGLGLVCGIVMNLLSQTGSPIVDWHHPVVWSSSLLLAWLVAATMFNLFYEPARYGRKVAYLTIATGLFLALELGIVLASGHGVIRVREEEAAVSAASRQRDMAGPVTARWAGERVEEGSVAGNPSGGRHS